MPVDKTVKNVELMWSRTNGALSTPDGRFRKMSLTETWSVVCGKDCTLTDVYNQTRVMSGVQSGIPMPKIATSHREIPRLLCKEVRPERLTPVYWLITVNYEGEVGPEDNPVESNPLNDPPDIMWTKVDSEEPIDEDVNHHAIATKAGEKYDGVTMTISDLVVNVKRNFLTINLAGTHAYLHSVNSDEFLGFAPGTAHLTQFSAKHIIAEEVGINYWEVNAAIQFRYPWRTTPERAWYKRLRHEGYYCLKEVKGALKPVRCLDKAKEPVIRPALLDEAGKQIPFSDELDQQAVWQEFEIYSRLPYRAMGLID